MVEVLWHRGAVAEKAFAPELDDAYEPMIVLRLGEDRRLELDDLCEVLAAATVARGDAPLPRGVSIAVRFLEMSAETVLARPRGGGGRYIQYLYIDYII
jgi:hypothetical protein